MNSTFPFIWKALHIKGKIERLWKTIRMQLLQGLSDTLSLQQLNAALQTWIDTDYHVRQHSSTKQAPLERYLAHIELIRPAPKNLRDFFRTPAFRTVERNTRTVSLNGKLYEAPEGLAGRRVQLLYDDQDPERIEVLCDNHSMGFLVPLNPEINSRVRRSSRDYPELLPKEVPSQKHDDQTAAQRYRGGQLFGGQKR